MRYYSSTAGAMSLTADVSAADGTITVSSTVGLPTSYPFTLVLDAGNGSEEIVEVASASGSSLTVSRGVDGTTPQSHSLGAAVRHMMTARDLREPQQHMAASSGVHDVTGSVVGTTDAQTLTNKTLASPSVTGTLSSNPADPAVGVNITMPPAPTVPAFKAIANRALGSKDTIQIAPNLAEVFSYAQGDYMLNSAASVKITKSGRLEVKGSQGLGEPTLTTLSVQGGSGGALNDVPTGIAEFKNKSGSVVASIDKDGKVSAPDGTFDGTAWTDVTVNSGFAAISAAEKPQVRRIGKTVYVQGGWLNTGMSVNSTHVIGTLPVGFRPTQNVLVMPGSSVGSVTATVFLSSSGDVSIRTGPALGSYYKPSATFLID